MFDSPPGSGKWYARPPRSRANPEPEKVAVESRQAGEALLSKWRRDREDNIKGGQGRNVETLQKYVDERYGSSGRGRAMPNVGEERKYKAQQIGDGGTFLRLPLTPIGVKKGGVVKVRFESDRVVVTKT